MSKKPLIILLVVVITFGCEENKTSSIIRDSVIVNDIARKFDAEEIYKELVRRSMTFTDSILLASQDTITSLGSYDTLKNVNVLKNARDTVMKPQTTDTVMLSRVKESFERYSDKELFDAYSEIIATRQETKGIYGTDNRQEISGNLPNNYLKASKTVFALIHRKYFQKNGEKFTLGSKGNYAKVYRLCNSDSFGDQDIYADCSAFAITQNVVASAGHCINYSNYTDYLLVTDLTLENLKFFNNAGGIPADNVFEISQVLDSKFSSDIDYSVFRVNKPIPSDRVVTLSNKTVYSNLDYFYVIGFPCGLPMKMCNSASFRRNNSQNFFQINSDTYGGNSGSPVFNENTNQVEGILVRGNKDFFFNDGNCASSIVCPEFGCRGEDVTKIHLIKKYTQ